MPAVLVLAVLLAVAAAGGAPASAEWTVFEDLSLTIAFGVDATAPDNVMLVGGVSGSGGSLVHSSDGFQTWTFQPHDPQFLYMGVSLASESVGIAGTFGFYGQIASGSYTVDGANWQGVGDDPLFSAVQSCHAYDNSTLLMFGWWQVDASNFLTGVAVSFDAGNRFQYVHWGFADQTVMARYGFALSPMHWIVAGGTWPASDENAMARAGHVFEHVRLRVMDDDEIKVTIDTSSPKDKAEGYVGVIMATTDGGATWRQAFYDEGNFYFNTVQCIRMRCWAIATGSGGGYLFSSTDSGATWSHQYFNANVSMTSMNFLNENEGWIVGAANAPDVVEAVFLHTLDGGSTWSQVPNIANIYPTAIKMVSSTRGYATAFLLSGDSALVIYDATEQANPK